MSDTGASPDGNYETELQRLECCKREAEVAKLKAEHQQLTLEWWRRPSTWAAVIPAIVASVTLFQLLWTRQFETKRTQLAYETSKLKDEKTQLTREVEDAKAYSEALKAVTAVSDFRVEIVGVDDEVFHVLAVDARPGARRHQTDPHRLFTAELIEQLNTIGIRASYGNLLTDLTLERFQQLEGLKHVSTWDSEISDKGLHHLQGCKAIERVDVSDAITDAGLGDLRGVPRLREIRLMPSHITPVGVRYLAGIASLKSIQLGYTELTDAQAVNLKDLVLLSELDIGPSKISDTTLKALRSLKHLSHLDIWGTSITDDGIDSIMSLPKLRKLILRETSITDVGLSTLAKMKSLEYVDIKGCTVTPHGVAKLREQLPNAEILFEDKLPESDVPSDDTSSG